MKFTQRFENLELVEKAYYFPKKLHLTIFYKEGFTEKEVKRRVRNEIQNSNFEASVETISFYLD